MDLPQSPHAELSEDETRVQVSLPGTGATFELDAAGLDHLIDRLGALRAGMRNQHPSAWPRRGFVDAIYNPPWYSEPELLQGNSLLHIRHPGFGWLHFSIPKPAAAKLAEFLEDQASATEETPQFKH